MVDFPVRNEQQQIGDAAARHFDNSIPSRWATNKSESDYGWDRIILITKEGSGEAREEFYVQIKGSHSVDYILENSFVSLSLERKTVNFLSAREMPVMIALCDMARPDKPIYWVWLQTAIEELEKRNTHWRNQETLTIRIPTSQLLANGIDRIESDVRAHASESRVAKMMLEIFSPHEKRSSILLPDVASIDETYITTIFLPTVSIPSAVLDSAGSVGADSRRDQLQNVSILLQENRDVRAEEILNELERDIEHTSPQIRATFHNSKGILALHRFQLKEAQEAFYKAVELNPSEPKHLTNALIVEYTICGQNALPEDWRDRLINVVRENPTFVPAARMHILLLARDSGLDAAEEFAKNSPAFSVDSKSLLVVLAEASEEQGDVERALTFIASAEKIAPEDSELLSVKAILLLRKAMDFRSESKGPYYIDGYGPSDLDIDTLRDSADVFDKACTALTNAGLPLWAETTFSNAASAFMMAHRFSDARHHCEIFLKRHATSIPVSAAMAMVLYHSGEASEAIEYASNVYNATKDPNSFKNLLLTLINRMLKNSPFEANYAR
jgi:tetratricopeptide (TPR) repeat protein